MIVSRVKEGSTAYLQADFLDSDGNLDNPSSINYSIQCMTNNQEVRADTPITPVASSIRITLEPADNVILNQANRSELRRVIVKATYGADDAVQDQYDYFVENLSDVP